MGSSVIAAEKMSHMDGQTDGRTDGQMNRTKTYMPPARSAEA